jgi:hypothetical protein
MQSMTDPSTLMVIAAVAAVVGPLLGAGAGTFFGLRSGLNGLKETAQRLESTLIDVRDNSRDTLNEMKHHKEDTSRRAGAAARAATQHTELLTAVHTLVEQQEE